MSCAGGHAGLAEQVVEPAPFAPWCAGRTRGPAAWAIQIRPLWQPGKAVAATFACAGRARAHPACQCRLWAVLDFRVEDASESNPCHFTGAGRGAGRGCGREGAVAVRRVAEHYEQDAHVVGLGWIRGRPKQGGLAGAAHTRAAAGPTSGQLWLELAVALRWWELGRRPCGPWCSGSASAASRPPAAAGPAPHRRGARGEGGDGGRGGGGGQGWPRGG